MVNDALGDRMKRYEDINRVYLPPRSYQIIRIDGKSFHNYTRGTEKPYDYELHEALDLAASALCKELMGCRFAYGQSDEYSFLATDFDGDEDSKLSEMWFGGNIQKITSVTASIFTAEFNYARFLQGEGHQPYVETSRKQITARFDARVFVLPCRSEVENYFIWRQQDATRNSISMLAHTHFSHKQLHGKNNVDMQDMLHGINVNWNDCPVVFKRGQIVRKCKQEREVSWVHKRSGEKHTESVTETYWGVDTNIPVFTQDREYLRTLIPTRY